VNPRRLPPDSAEIPAALALIRAAFAYMDRIVDPPSSIHRMDEPALRAEAARAELWVIGAPGALAACGLFTPHADALYLGKLAVAEDRRGEGLARALIDHAAHRARALGLPCLELQTRVELAANHAAFAAMGFAQVAETAHPGYDRPTSLTFRKPL